MSILRSKVFRILTGIAVLGFVVSFPPLLGWLGSQPYWVPFVVWYGIFFLFILWIGITLSPGRFRLRHAIGFLVVYFSISPVLGWIDNPFISQGLTGATITGVESGPEETLLTYFFINFTQDPNILIFLVYILSPILFAIAALWILKPKFFVSAFHRLVGP